MATYVKGDKVANATSYQLYEVNGSTETAVGSPASEINFDVSALNLAEGSHVLGVRAMASGYTTSDLSNTVTYTVTSAGGGNTGGNTGGGTTSYTITYYYIDSASATIKAPTTETVTAGITRTFSTSNAPSISGYTISSVSPTSATINSNTIVTYTYNANSGSGDSGGGGDVTGDVIDISNLFTTTWQQGAMAVSASNANYPGPQTNQSAYRCSNKWVDVTAYESIINSGATLQITMTRAVNTNHTVYGLLFYSEAVKDAGKVLGTLAMQYEAVDFGVYSVETREIAIPSGTKYIRTTWLPEAKETELGAVFSAKIIKA